MWHLLDDDVLSHIATVGAWESLHVLRRLERRCAQIEKARTRLRCIRPLFFPPFSIHWKKMTRLHLSFWGLDYGAMQVFASAVASGALAQAKVCSLATALLPCPEPWHAHSPGSEILFDVQYTPMHRGSTSAATRSLMQA